MSANCHVLAPSTDTSQRMIFLPAPVHANPGFSTPTSTGFLLCSPEVWSLRTQSQHFYIHSVKLLRSDKMLVPLVVVDFANAELQDTGKLACALQTGAWKAPE